MKIKDTIQKIVNETAKKSEKDAQEYLQLIFKNMFIIQNRGVQALEAFCIAILSSAKLKTEDTDRYKHSKIVAKAQNPKDKIHKIIMKYGCEIDFLINSGLGAKRIKKYLIEKHKINISLSSVKNILKEIRESRDA